MYYHFLRKDECLRYPPFTKVEVGQTLTCEGKLKLCKNGLHASKKLIDALRYAPGPILCEVELGGEVIESDDKVCARSRTVVSMRDISLILHEFACQVAEQALKDHNVTDERSWNAIATKRQWLRGSATDAELDVANATARYNSDVSRTAARAAALATSTSAVEAAMDAASATVWAARTSTASAARASVTSAATWAPAEAYGAVSILSIVSKAEWVTAGTTAGVAAGAAKRADNNDLLMELLCTTTS